MRKAVLHQIEIRMKPRGDIKDFEVQNVFLTLELSSPSAQTDIESIGEGHLRRVAIGQLI
jgi:hypothetical protein